MEMEKTCEFCLILRPIVYCKADAAHLCLSCDAKVHSANALSNRHTRAIVCESCRYRPSYVQCSDHQMFMCRPCDRNQHDLSSQHQRKVMSCYTGCPSAKDFAALWGLDLNELDNDSKSEYQSLPTSSAAVSTGVLTFNNSRQSCSVAGISSVFDVASTTSKLPKVRSRGKGTKAAVHRKNIFHVLEQINDLKRLQLTQGDGKFSFMRSQGEIDMSSFKFHAKRKMHENLDQHLQHALDLGSDLHGSHHENPTTEPFQLAFSQMDGDSFWQCKSPVQSGQLWTQNMQDLGVCDELGCSDDFTMPDVDSTFKNIEELFGGEQELARALLDDNYTTCSSVEKDMSINKSDNGYERSVEDVSASSSVCISYSANVDNDVGSSDFTTTKEHPSIKPSYSALSLSLSKLSAECVDSEPCSSFKRQQLSSNLSDLENAQLECKENNMTRYKEKKKARSVDKQSRYSPRKAKSDVKKLVRDQFVKIRGCESDSVNFSRSF
nr:putative zinc finger protein At1g68190 isoform X1 [Coffea arabica]XP_027097785.1 putative zinc finger protein At1g68190 isoform X1 [Coffea arabica]